MFERFTEKSRRVVFFARYEAAQYGSPRVETHHLLLALFREDRELMRRCVGTPGEVDAIRQKLEQQFPPARVQTFVDLPMSDQTARVLVCAGEEAERMGHSRIVETGHLLLGILREPHSAAAEILAAHGVELGEMRREISSAHVGTLEAAHIPLVDPHHVHWPPASPPAGRRYSNEDLERLSAMVPESRREAAGRVLEALAESAVSLAVAGSGGAFSYSFRGAVGAVSSGDCPAAAPAGPAPKV